MPEQTAAATGNHMREISLGMGWLEAAAILAVAGCIGGLGSAILNRELPFFTADGLRESKMMLVRYTVCHCILGAAVAVGSLFFIIFLPFLPSLDDGARRAFLLGAGVLFGLFALRLLPIFERDLIVRISGKADRAEGKADRAETVAQQAIEQSKRTDVDAQRATLMAALTAVASGTKAQAINVDDTINEVERFLDANPSERKLSIVLGNVLFDKKKDKQRAVDRMTKLINALRPTPPESRTDELRKNLGDAYYNRVCYVGNDPNDPARRDEPGVIKANPSTYRPTNSEIAQVKADLKECFEITPENKADAASDPDFAVLRDIPELREFFT